MQKRFFLQLSGASLGSLQEVGKRFPLKVVGAATVIGNSLSLYEAPTGKDWLRGTSLSIRERVIAFAATRPGEAAIPLVLKVLGRAGAIRAFDKVPGLEKLALNLPEKVYETIESTAFQAGWVPLRCAMRSARDDSKINHESVLGTLLLDQIINLLQLLGYPGSSDFGLPEQVVHLIKKGVTIVVISPIYLSDDSM